MKGTEKEQPTRNSGWCRRGRQQALPLRPWGEVLSTSQMPPEGPVGLWDLKGGRRSLVMLERAVCKASWSQELDDGEFWRE